MRLSSGFSDVSRGILQQLPGTLEDGRSSKGLLFSLSFPLQGRDVLPSFSLSSPLQVGRRCDG